MRCAARTGIKYETANEVKFGTRPNVRLGPGSQGYFDTIHRAKFTQFLSGITGIQALVTDPMLRGGGLHEIRWAASSRCMSTFTRHVDTKLDNRLVFITYLNKGWQPEWGGALELWTRAACVREVVPVFGRSIVFMHTADSLHGHPDPVNTPDGRTRRSVAAYFYTNGRPDPTPAERITTRFLDPEVTTVAAARACGQGGALRAAADGARRPAAGQATASPRRIAASGTSPRPRCQHIAPAADPGLKRVLGSLTWFCSTPNISRITSPTSAMM